MSDQPKVTEADKLARIYFMVDWQGAPGNEFSFNDLLDLAFARHREQAIREEREACAKVADDIDAEHMKSFRLVGGHGEHFGRAVVAHEIAIAIRSRGEKA